MNINFEIGDIPANEITINGIKYIREHVKLKEGKWYKYPDHQKWNFYITKINHTDKKVKGFGFGTDGLWMENALNDSWDFEELESIVEMSDSEVFEVLKNEAIKRGFVKGAYIKGMDSNEDLILISEHYGINFEKDSLTLYYEIFRSGIWAEIRTITKEEAKKQLGKKIID